jgi:hypothetical protein
MTGTLQDDLRAFITISRWILLRMRNIADKSLEKIKTHILCSITFARKSRRFLDNVEIMLQPNRSQVTI